MRTPDSKKKASVKAIQTLTQSSADRAKSVSDFPEARRAVDTAHKSKIEWITDEEIAEAGKRLLELKRAGIQREKEGDFGNSGKIAFKLRDFVSEINKTTKSVLGP